MLTAEEFIKNNVPNTCIVLPEWLIEFTKLHVQAALESVIDNYKTLPPYHEDIDLDSIINAYPLENIK